MGIQCVRTSFESPRQNGIAERWVESCRRDLLDHVIALNESHLKRLLSDYVRYYHDDRTHLGLSKETPNHRPCATGAPVASVAPSAPSIAQNWLDFRAERGRSTFDQRHLAARILPEPGSIPGTRAGPVGQRGPGLHYRPRAI